MFYNKKQSEIAEMVSFQFEPPSSFNIEIQRLWTTFFSVSNHYLSGQVIII